jgi:DNA-binding response OmpR family regulator
VSRILIVDDEPDILLMLRVALEAAGHVTALAADGESAVRRLSREDFDLMLLDVMMPVMDGWGVLEALGGLPAPPRVIVVSARTTAGDVARAVDLGATDYIHKPFVMTDLVGRIPLVAGWSGAEIDANRERLRPR